MSSAGLFSPSPLALPNYDFEQAGAAPGTNWAAYGTAVASYDTATPYEGTQSLVITSSADDGVTSYSTFPAVAGQLWSITAAIKSNTGAAASVGAEFFDANNNSLGTISQSTTSLSWILVTASGRAPFAAVKAQVFLTVNAGAAEFDVVQPMSIPANAYYVGLLTSQYQNSPNLKALIALLVQPFVDTALCAQSLVDAFSLNEAVGTQLDAIGQLVGVSRTLPFVPDIVSTTLAAAITTTGSQYFDPASTSGMVIGSVLNVDSGGNAETVTITGFQFTYPFHPQATFTKTHASGVAIVEPGASSVLGDGDYLTLIRAKIVQNQWNGQGGNLWDSWQQIFPGSHVYITDNQNMTVDVFIVGSFTVAQQEMITNGLILPRPQGVEYIYTFGALPIFGFDNLNPSLVAGFDIGNWA